MLNAIDGASPWREIIENKRDDVCDLEIQRKVCDLWGVTIHDMRSPCSTRRLSQARCALVYALRSFTDLTAVEIGTFLGRDPSTISYISGRAVRLAEEDDLYGKRLQKLVLFCKYWRP